MELRTAYDVRAFAQMVQEDYASELFDLHGIALRIRRAARLGHLSLHVHQDRPLDLRETSAAGLLCHTLELAGYETEWVEVKKLEHGLRGDPPREFAYYELLVQWHGRVHHASGIVSQRLSAPNLVGWFPTGGKGVGPLTAASCMSTLTPTPRKTNRRVGMYRTSLSRYKNPRRQR